MAWRRTFSTATAVSNAILFKALRRSLPCISLACDQCSVCFGAAYALQWKLGVTAEMLSDASHRDSNDLLAALRESGPWLECVLLLSLRSKVNFGPWLGAAFLRQLESAAERFQQIRGLNCPLFSSFLDAIAHDRDQPASAVGDTKWVAAVFAELASDKVCRRKGPFLQLCRWMSWIDCIEYWDDCWHLRLVLMLFWAMSEGLVVSSDGVADLTIKSLAPPAAGGARHKMRESREKGKLAEMRGRGKNGLHAAMLVLQILGLQRIARIMCVVCDHRRAWHGWQATHVPVESAHEFFRDQASGECLAPLFGSFRTMSEQSHHRRCGFVMDLADLPAEDGEANPVLDEECELM